MNEINFINVFNEAKKNILQIISITLIIFFLGFIIQNLFFNFDVSENEKRNNYVYSINLNHKNIIQSLSDCHDNFFSTYICSHQFFYKDAFKILNKNYFIFTNFEYLKKLFLEKKLNFESFEIQSITNPYDDLSNNQILELEFFFSASSNYNSNLEEEIQNVLLKYYKLINNTFIKHIKNEILSQSIERKSFLKYNIQLTESIEKNPLLNSENDYIKDTILKTEFFKIELAEIQEVIDQIDQRISIFKNIIYFDFPDGKLNIDNVQTIDSFNIVTYYYLILFASLFINLLYLSLRITYKKKINS